MARILAIDWDPPRLNILAGATSKANARAERSLTVTLDEDLTPSSAEHLGRRLREALKEADLAPAPVFWIVGRDKVILKEIILPPVAAHEEAAIVRFQAAKEMTDVASEVVLDYTHVAPPQAGQPGRVLAVIVKKSIVQAVTALCQAAGLKLQGIVPRPFAVSGLLARSAPAATVPMCQAILLPTGAGSEFTVFRGDSLLWARSFPAAANLTAELARNLLLLTAQKAEAGPVQKLLSAVPGDLTSLGMPVEPLEVWQPDEPKPQPPESYLAPLGMLEAARRPGGLAINLAAPKEPRPVVDNARRKRILALVLAAVLVPIGLTYHFMSLSAKRAQIQSLQDDKDDYEDRWKKSAQDRLDVDALKEWEDTTISWLDEFHDLAARMPHEVGLRLTQVAAGPLSRKTAKDRFVANIKLHGVTTGDQDTLVTKFLEAAHKDPHLRPSPASFRGQEFTVNIAVASQPKAKYSTRLEVPARARIPSEPEKTEESMTEEEIP